MNKLLIILLLSLTACSTLKQQSSNNKQQKYIKLEKFKGDTLSFVQNSILNRKEFYKGKELNVLLKDLAIPIVHYTTGVTFRHKDQSPHISLYPYNDTEKDKKITKKEDPIIITIVWQTPLRTSYVDSLSIRNKSNWTPEVQEYFGKQIVKDIGKVNFSFNK
ncbi:hypothetical protein I5M32_11410 [Pedobacter sp. SD-b]|uniref:Lipoprotein n=1 Tax=Pedobacter segetis TaxID=2793069 RepID=A0ABS1BKZ3_9SPHI|nr:hypothetical protein [Pedobacter segetis]MBK0383565.1 hypothetical protein [Pedobacter segetis]